MTDNLHNRYPHYIDIFLEALRLWYLEPFVTTPTLKLMSELALNRFDIITMHVLIHLILFRSQRLAFDVTSPNGVLLFREASKTIVTYGGQILSLTDVPSQHLYPRKYPYYQSYLFINTCTIYIFNTIIIRLKGISICFGILRSALCGSYVNFGVLKLYGDTAMDSAMDVFIKLLISLPLKNLLVRSC